MKRLIIAYKRGFCLGVENALQMTENALSNTSETIYIRKALVHNDATIRRLTEMGAVIVEDVDNVPINGIVVFSAHGVSPDIYIKAKERHLKIIDTTCKLVKKIHNEVVTFRDLGYTIILIGERGHKEVIGIMGEAPGKIHLISNIDEIDSIPDIDNENVAWVSQTTLNVDDTTKIVEKLRVKFPLIHNPPKSDICFATKERQSAVKRIAGECDCFIVIGSETSSNTKQLCTVAAKSGVPKVIRIDDPTELSDIDFSSIDTIGITTGVSTSEDQLDKLIAYLESMGYLNVKDMKDSYIGVSDFE